MLMMSPCSVGASGTRGLHSSVLSVSRTGQCIFALVPFQKNSLNSSWATQCSGGICFSSTIVLKCCLNCCSSSGSISLSSVLPIFSFSNQGHLSENTAIPHCSCVAVLANRALPTFHSLRLTTPWGSLQCPEVDYFLQINCVITLGHWMKNQCHLLHLHPITIFVLFFHNLFDLLHNMSSLLPMFAW